MTAVNLLLLIGMIIGSAFFSGSETALVMASRVKLEIWIKRHIKGAEKTLTLLSNPHKFLATTLVGTNISVVIASSLLAIYLEPYLKGIWITLIASLILLFWAEMLPKEIARQRPASLAVFTSWGLRVFYYLFYPVIWLVMGISRMLIQLSGSSQEMEEKNFSRKDLDRLMREGHQMGLLEAKHRDLISRFILRNRLKVRDIMVPRTEIAFVQKKESLENAAMLFEQTGFSRIPVVDEEIDHVVGIVTAKDILLNQSKKLSTIHRKVLFAPELQQIGDLLQMMKKKQTTIAIVVDEYGGTAGLVTLEDIVEEFFGEIVDEFDEVQKLHRNGNAGQLEVKAKICIEDLKKAFHIHLPEGEYQTLGGFLMDRLGRVPKRKEKLETDEYIFTILSATRKKIHWVRIREKTYH